MNSANLTDGFKGRIVGDWPDIPRYDRLLAKWKEVHPEIETFSEIYEAHRAEAREYIARQQEISERSGAMGVIGQFAGGFAGSLDPVRDPLYSTSLLFGAGAGGSLLRAVLIEMGIGTAVESVQQFGFVNPRYEREGFEGNQPWFNIAAAGVGAGALAGLFRIGGKVLGKVKERRAGKAQARERDEAFVEAIEAAPRERPAPMTNKELLELVDDEDLDLVDAPSLELDRQVLKQKVRESDRSPHPETARGEADTEAEITVATATLQGERAPSDVETRAEVAQGEIEGSPADVQARQEAPALFNKIDEVTAEVAELRDAVEALRTRSPVGRAVPIERDEPDLTKLKKDLEKAEARLDEAKKPGEKQGREGRIEQLQRRLDAAEADAAPRTIQELREHIDKLKADRIAATNAAWKGGLTRRIKALEKELETAELNAARDLEPELAKREAQLAALSKEARARRAKAAREQVKVARANEVPPADNPIPTQPAAHEIEEMVKDIPDEDPAVAIASITPDENGQVEVGGTGFTVASDKKMFDDGATSIDDVLEEFGEDEKLLAQMKSCAGGTVDA